MLTNRIGPESPFPLILRTAVTYGDNITLTQGAVTVPYTYSFCANKLYDPNNTGTGHQPRFFDTLCGANNGTAPYYQYRVISSKIEVTVFPTSSNGTNDNAMVSVLPRLPSATAPNSIMEMQERPFSKHAYVNTLGSYKPIKLHNFVNCVSFAGQKDIEDAENLEGDYAGNGPSTVIYWDISACSVSDAGQTTVTALVKITYFVEFFDNNDVANS